MFVINILTTYQKCKSVNKMHILMKEFIFITIILHIILRLFNNVIKYFILNQINGFYHTHLEKENIYFFYRVFLKSHRFRNNMKCRKSSHMDFFQWSNSQFSYFFKEFIKLYIFHLNQVVFLHSVDVQESRVLIVKILHSVQ